MAGNGRIRSGAGPRGNHFRAAVVAARAPIERDTVPPAA
jgi:hypothetical protein